MPRLQRCGKAYSPVSDPVGDSIMLLSRSAFRLWLLKIARLVIWGVVFAGFVFVKVVRALIMLPRKTFMMGAPDFHPGDLPVPITVNPIKEFFATLFGPLAHPGNRRVFLVIEATAGICIMYGKMNVRKNHRP